jgi:hypothetical protein
MKRFLSIALVGLMGLGFFACTKKDESTAPATDPAVNAPPADTAPAAPPTEAAPAPEAQPGS